MKKFSLLFSLGLFLICLNVFAKEDYTATCYQIIPPIGNFKVLQGAEGANLFAVKNYHTDGGFSWGSLQVFGHMDNEVLLSDLFSDHNVGDKGKLIIRRNIKPFYTLTHTELI